MWTNMSTVVVVFVLHVSSSHGYPKSSWNKHHNGQLRKSSLHWETQKSPDDEVPQSDVDDSDQLCSLTLKIPKADIQCSQKSPDVTKQMRSLRSYCDRRVSEAEERLRMYLQHEASVRLELEQRLLYVENASKIVNSKPDRGSGDSADKKLLQHMLNRLHIEKLAREDLENKVNQLKQKLQVLDSAIDCEFIRRPGEYHVQPLTSDKLVQVYCDRGWTIIQRRIDGSVNFYRGWQAYREGFGDLNGEFWLGNDNTHRITTQAKYRLKIEMEDLQGNQYYAEYSHFWIDSHREKYRLHVSGHHGNIDDALAREDLRHNHNDMPFSTPGQNNQPNKTSYCAEIYHGAWWYNSCYSANLNGRFCSHSSPDKNVEEEDSQCMIWWGGGDTKRIIMKNVIMKVKEVSDSILYLKTN